MRVAITGAHGFLGWHTACHLRAVHKVEPVRLGREDFQDVHRMVNALSGVDAVLHLAGVNRAETHQQVEDGNVELAQFLSAALRKLDRPVNVVYANSVQANLDNAYGRGKAKAADILGDATRAAGGAFADLLLPNLFGEHGQPGYNSFVATFAHEVAAGRNPTVTGDRAIELLHAQEAAAHLIGAIGLDATEVLTGESIRISRVLEILQEFNALYATTGYVPDISTAMRRDLFNTYRAAKFPDMWPIVARVHTDDRGALYETVRSHGGTGMAYVSTTRPGQKRGEHYHLRKVERFSVVKGEAIVQLRRLLHDEIITFRMSGDEPSFVDMPTLWVHNLVNVGTSDLTTMFWSDQLLDPQDPDQYPEAVVQKESA